jgi:hypothetical protein
MHLAPAAAAVHAAAAWVCPGPPLPTNTWAADNQSHTARPAHRHSENTPVKQFGNRGLVASVLTYVWYMSTAPCASKVASTSSCQLECAAHCLRLVQQLITCPLLLCASRYAHASMQGALGSPVRPCCNMPFIKANDMHRQSIRTSDPPLCFNMHRHSPAGYGWQSQVLAPGPPTP